MTYVKIQPKNSSETKHEKFKKKIESLYPGKYILLSDYIGSNNRITVQYVKCGHIGTPKASYLIQGSGCSQCNRGTRLTEEEFLNRFNDIAGDEYYVLDEYENTRQTIHIQHKKCGLVFTRAVSSLFATNRCLCPKCYPNSATTLIPGLNDVYTVMPHLVGWFKNQEDAKHITPMSHKKCVFKCPICGNEEVRSMNHVTTYGLNCKVCNLNNSYGERFISALLLELGIPFKPQFSPKWANGYRYDFQLLTNIIVEVDGGWHYSNNRLSGKTLEEQLQVDSIKERLAQENGYHIIRIDYNYSTDRINHIIHSILNSELAIILKIDSNYDFKEIIDRVSIPIVKQVADLWNSYPDKYSWYIRQDLNLSDATVRNYLTQAYWAGLIDESPEEVVKINLRMSSRVHKHSRTVKVLCNETGEVFNQIKDANKKYHASVGSYLRENNRKYSGTLPDGTRLTWTKIA